MKIRILHVPGTRPIGGIGSLLKSFDMNYDRDNFDISYIYSVTNDSLLFDNFVSANNSKVYHLPKFNFRNIFSFIKEINKFYKENSNYIDVLHVHCPYYGIFHLFFSKLYGINNTIIHSHSSKYSDSKLKAIRNSIIALSAKKFYTKRLACSKKSAYFLFGNKTHELINNCIDTKKFTYDREVELRIRKLLSIKNDEFIIGHIGSFVPLKNHSFIIELFSKFIEKCDNSRLILIGTGQYLESIVELAKNKGVDNKILFLRQIDNVSEIMSCFNCFILPSLFEGFPVSLVEAQSMGIQCLVSDSIADEIKLTDLVTFLPIENDNCHLWVDQMLEIRNQPIIGREKYPNILREKGFDSYLETKKLENIYDELSKNK